MNRCLAEGRARFRNADLAQRGRHAAALSSASSISAFCDGEAGARGSRRSSATTSTPACTAARPCVPTGLPRPPPRRSRPRCRWAARCSNASRTLAASVVGALRRAAPRPTRRWRRWPAPAAAAAPASRRWPRPRRSASARSAGAACVATGVVPVALPLARDHSRPGRPLERQRRPAPEPGRRGQPEPAPLARGTAARAGAHRSTAARSRPRPRRRRRKLERRGRIRAAAARHGRAAPGRAAERGGGDPAGEFGP